MTPLEAAALLERLQDQRFFLGPHAAQRPDPAVPAGSLEIVERPNAKLTVEGRDGLGADPLQTQNVEDARREFGEQLAMVFRVARLADLTDPRGEVFADARDLPQARFVETPELVRVVGRDVGAVPIRANLERVLVLDLEEVGNLPENPRDRLITQGGGLRSRSDSRAGVRHRPRARP